MKITIITKNEDGMFAQTVNNPYEFDIDFNTKTVSMKITELFEGKQIYNADIFRFHEIVNIKGESSLEEKILI